MRGRVGLRARTDFRVISRTGKLRAHYRGIELSASGIVIDRGRRKRDIATLGLQEIPGVGPTRKRALLRHFGTLATVENASVTDLQKVPGISAATAQAIYDFFHANG